MSHVYDPASRPTVVKQDVRNAAMLVASLGVIAFFGGYVLLGFAARDPGRLDNTLIAARKAGLPLTIADLHIQPVPENLNAAPIYREADILSKGLSVEMKSMNDGNTSERKTLVRGLTLHEYATIQGLQPIFDILDKLPQRPLCNFNRDWSLGAKMLFPELSGLKTDVKVLCYRADYQDRTGDPIGAVKSMKLASRVASDASSDPIIIGELVNVSSRAIIDREWENLLNRHSRDAEFLADAGKEIDSEATFPQLPRALSGEVVLGKMTIETMHSFADLGSPNDQPPFAEAVLRSRFVRTAVESNYIDTWTSMWRNLPKDKNDWQACDAALRQVDAEVKRETSAESKVTQMIIPTFSEAGSAIGVSIAHQRMLETSVKLLQMRIATGELPSELPAKLAKGAIDPFDGNTLRYRREGTGFKLYSIGADCVDNGGVPRSTNSGDSGYDEVISLS